MLNSKTRQSLLWQTFKKLSFYSLYSSKFFIYEDITLSNLFLNCTQNKIVERPGLGDKPTWGRKGSYHGPDWMQPAPVDEVKKKRPWQVGFNDWPYLSWPRSYITMLVWRNYVHLSSKVGKSENISSPGAVALWFLSRCFSVKLCLIYLFLK